MTAFLLTWKETGWPHENIVRMVEGIQAHGYVDEPWRLTAHNLAKPGDRVFVLKQGRQPKGIFGTGEIVGVPARADAGNGKIQWMAPVRFNTFVDPKQQLLIGDEVTASILRKSQLNAQASGYPLDDSQSTALTAALTSGLPVELGGSGDWTQAEIAAIVADYFSMLQLELAGQPYSKTEHRNVLRRIVQRSPGSIERKHQNLSAVLQRLSLPWIDGYKPLPNLQDALADAVEKQLDHSIANLEQSVNFPKPAWVDPALVFVAAPAPNEGKAPTQNIARLIRKFDPTVRDAANRKLGLAGEEFVSNIERNRLVAQGRDDLALKVAWVSKYVGDGFGYDIESYEPDGSTIYIEVKTTRGPIHTPFFLSENERQVAATKGIAYRLYRLFNYGEKPLIFTLNGPLDGVLTLKPVSYRAFVGAKPD